MAWVQKHVANQLLLHTRLDWLAAFRHVVVLRHPLIQLASLETGANMARVEDTCIPHQLAIFRWVAKHLEELAHAHPEFLTQCDRMQAEMVANGAP